MGWFGVDNVTLEGILGYVFAPLAFLIGVPWDEAVRAGSFIGQKLILNEFVAYSNFGPVIGEFSDKTAIIISFALCGFANLSSMGILIGGLGGMAPEKRTMISKLALKSVAAGTLASLLSASSGLSYSVTADAVHLLHKLVVGFVGVRVSYAEPHSGYSILFTHFFNVEL